MRPRPRLRQRARAAIFWPHSRPLRNREVRYPASRQTRPAMGPYDGECSRRDQRNRRHFHCYQAGIANHPSRRADYLRNCAPIKRATGIERAQTIFAPAREQSDENILYPFALDDETKLTLARRESPCAEQWKHKK